MEDTQINAKITEVKRLIASLKRKIVDIQFGHDHDGFDSKTASHANLTGVTTSQHHTKYTDAEAVTAAKTVKIDDLTAADDNTDLNSSTSAHGLLLKLDNDDTHYLNGQGAWAAPAGAGREIFYPVAPYLGAGAELSYDGTHPGMLIDGAAEWCITEFFVPADFTTITNSVVVVISKATATHRLNFDTNYAASGEDKDTHTGSAADVDTAMTDELIYEIDISSALASLAASDYVGVKVTGDDTNIPDVLVLGVRFKYT